MFTVRLATATESFDGDPVVEVKRILRDLTKKMDPRLGTWPQVWSLKDSGGHTVGSAKLTSE